MAFKDLIGKAQELTDTTTQAAGKYIDEFNEALPTMQALGFTVKDLRVGIGGGAGHRIEADRVDRYGR